MRPRARPGSLESMAPARGGGPRTTEMVRADGTLMRRLTLWVPADLARQLRHAAAERDVSQSEIMIGALRRELERKPRR